VCAVTTTQEETPAIDPMAGTGAAMIAFLELIQKRGDMVPATASALRTGVKKVLDTDTTLLTDMRNVEVDEVVRQFRNKNWSKLSEKSVNVYEQRFRQSVEMYRRWLNQEKDWLPARSRNAAPRKTNGSRNAAQAAMIETAAVTPVHAQAEPMSHTGMITYPLVIRPGVKATLILPEDLTRREAERVGQFVAALAFDEQLALPARRTVDAELVD